MLFFIFFSFCFFSQNGFNATASQDVEFSLVENEDGLMYDFVLGSYCGEYYIKILTHDVYPDYSLFSWRIHCSADQQAQVLDWLYPYDASFAEAPYLYRWLTFDSSYIPVCTITMLYNGAEVASKVYTILGSGAFMPEVQRVD